MRYASNLALACLLLTGCGHARTIATGVVAASDVAADTLADSWTTATATRVDACRAKDLQTIEERVACMGELHPERAAKLLAAVKVLVAAQLAVKAAVECEKLDTCASTPDWTELAAQVQAAWDALQPYMQTLKGLDQ